MTQAEFLNPVDWELIVSQVDADFGNGVTRRLSEGLTPVKVPRRSIFSVYLVPEEWVQYIRGEMEDFRLSSLGVWMGDLSSDTFRLSIAIVERLANISENELVVADTGAQAFTYGRSILRESVVSISPESLRRGQRVIVKSEEGDCLGLAALSVDASRIDRLSSDKLVAKNLVDVGWYLRRLG